MKSWSVAILIWALPVVAQQRQNFVINVGTPEGQILQSIGQASDEAKKLALMQDFLEKYATHEGAGWVAAQLELAYLKDKQYDKALEAAGKVAPDGPNDLDVSYSAVKAAEGKGDVEQLKKWSTRTTEAARKLTGKPPADDDEKAAQEYVKQVGAYAEYALYGQASKSRDAKVIVDLGETLEKNNPKSPYMWLISPNYLRSLGAKGCATAEKLAASDSRNGEAMLFAAHCNWSGQRADRVLALGSRALEAFNSRPKVDGGNESTKAGSANFYIGTAYAMQAKWGPANKALQAALPSIKGDSTILANALFNLGLANYTLGKALGDKSQMRAGLKYFQQCAELASNVQDQASRNARMILTELGGK
jgi:hypothetical protein